MHPHQALAAAAPPRPLRLHTLHGLHGPRPHALGDNSFPRGATNARSHFRLAQALLSQLWASFAVDHYEQARIGVSCLVTVLSQQGCLLASIAGYLLPSTPPPPHNRWLAAPRQHTSQRHCCAMDMVVPFMEELTGVDNSYGCNFVRSLLLHFGPVWYAALEDNELRTCPQRILLLHNRGLASLSSCHVVKLRAEFNTCEFFFGLTRWKPCRFDLKARTLLLLLRCSH